ncbi:MAG TPA: hypothetical protein VJ890_03635 [Vineibacter sp.]|nr:hypothetical protein [Vineibacter sp.]
MAEPATRGTDEVRWGKIDTEVEELRRQAQADMGKVIELLSRGDALRRPEMLAQIAILVMRHQQVTLTMLRHLNWEVRLMRRQLRDRGAGAGEG